MTRFNRRKLLASGTALGVTGLFGSLSTAADEHGEEAETQDVEVEYEYLLEGEGDDEQLEERLELSSGEYHYSGDEDEPQNCYVTFSAENVSDDEIRVDFWATVNGHSTWETQSLLDPGESGGARLESLNPDSCPTDPDQVTITARSPYIGDPHEPPGDEEDEEETDEEPEDEEDSEDEDVVQDVEVEYEYELADDAYGDDEHVEERLELSAGEYRIHEHEGRPDHCNIRFEAENLTDDEELTVYVEGRVDDYNTQESSIELEPTESISMSVGGEDVGNLDDCPDDPNQVVVRARAPYVGEPDEPPEDAEDEEEADEEPEDEDEPDDDGATDDTGTNDSNGADDADREDTDDEDTDDGAPEDDAGLGDDDADDGDETADEDEPDDDGATDDGAPEDDDAGLGDENADDEDETTDEDEGDDGAPDDGDADDVPGFTTGAGLVGGAVGLEWLRRQADTDDSTE